MGIRKKIALFDMDGTTVDYMGQLQADLNALAAPQEPLFDIYAPNTPEWIERRMDLVKLKPNWWFQLPKLEIGFKILEETMKIGFDCRILTKGPFRATTAWTQKRDWCHINMPKEVKVTITEDKSDSYGRVLVDDYADYMLAWLEFRPRGIGIMPVNPGNKNFSHPSVLMYDGTNDDALREKLQIAYNRP